LPVFSAKIGIVESEYNEAGGVFLRAARTAKTDHVLNMARFLRASGGTPGTKNEKQTKGDGGAWQESEARSGTKRGNYGLIPTGKCRRKRWRKPSE
jgi:hypothetical protein